MSDQSYDNIPRASSPSSDDLDSLPSTSASTTSISPSEEEWQSDAEREWKESLQQLELLLTMVLVPYLGKYFGRKAAYWGLFAPTLCDVEVLIWRYRMDEVYGVEISCAY
jgi:hypothetical protein